MLVQEINKNVMTIESDIDLHTFCSPIRSPDESRFQVVIVDWWTQLFQRHNFFLGVSFYFCGQIKWVCFNICTVHYTDVLLTYHRWAKMMWHGKHLFVFSKNPSMASSIFVRWLIRTPSHWWMYLASSYRKKQKCCSIFPWNFCGNSSQRLS